MCRAARSAPRGLGVGALDRVAIIDDEPAILSLMCEIVRHGGWEALPFAAAEPALPALRAAPPRAALIDLYLPGMSGIAACQALRADPATAKLPILIVTGSLSEENELLGFDVGADDVIEKPLSVAGVIARLRAVIRRTSPSSQEGRPVVAGPLVIDARRSEARLDGRTLNLTPTELRILSLLAAEPERVHTRTDLLGEDTGDVGAADRRIDTHVSSLRRKLGCCHWLVDTVYGRGYRLGRRAQPLAP